MEESQALSLGSLQSDGETGHKLYFQMTSHYFLHNPYHDLNFQSLFVYDFIICVSSWNLAL